MPFRMTKLKVISFATYLTDIDVKWRNQDYTSHKIVKSLKREEFQGYIPARVDGKWRRLTTENAADLHPTLHQIVAKELVERFPDGATLVPIPNSHVVASDTDDFRTLEFAEGVRDASNEVLDSAPALVFSEALPKAHSGSGSRDPRFLQEKYKLLSKPESPVILIDDVYTSGGHLIAAAWVLRDQNINVSLACAWARTTDDRPEKVFAVVEDELELDRGIADFRDFDFD